MSTHINSFIRYIRNNTFLVGAMVIVGLITYGAHIFNYTIGIDSDCYMSAPNEMIYRWYVQEGRFGLTFFHMLFYREEGLNSYASNICAVIILIFSCLLWCWIIERYSKKRNVIGLLMFSVFYLSSVVWLEINYFTYMAVACMVGVALMPLSVVFAWEGIRNRKKKLIILALVLLVIGISIYQLMVALFFCGILLVYCLEFENGEIEKKRQYKYLLDIVAFIVTTLITYFLINRLVLCCFNTEIDSYVTSKLQQGSIISKIKSICYLIYTIVIGDNNIIDSFMEAFRGKEINAWRGSLLFLFALIVYVYRNWTNKKNNTIAYYLATFLMFVSVISPAIISNGSASDRYLHALPLVSGYVVYCMIDSVREWKRPMMILGLGLGVVFAFRQMWSSSMLMQSNLMRYQYDVQLCNNVNRDIITVWNDNSLIYEATDDDIEVVILGEYPFDYGENHRHGEIIGVSAVAFGARGSKIESTLRMIPFMETMGYRYNPIDKDDERLDSIRKRAVDMPIYPNKGYIEIIDGVTVVKLSELVYKE